MSVYIDLFQTIFNKLAGIGSTVDDDTKVATLLASFGDKSKSPYGQLVTALQTTGTAVSWNTATARLLQEFNEKSINGSLGGGSGAGGSMALNTRHRKKYFGPKKEYPPKWKKKVEKRRCFECRQLGHIARHCPKKKQGDTSFENSTFDASANHASMLMAIADTVPTQKCCDNTHGHFNCAVHNSSVRSVDKMYRDSCNVEPTVGTTFIPSIKDTDDRLLLDSGASGYMVRRHDWFVNLRNIQPKSIFVGNGDVLMARKIGDIRLKVILSDKCGADDIVRTIIIRNVLYVPDLAINLISCSQLCENAYDIKFKGHRGRAMLNGYIEFECRMEDGVYVINCAVGNAGSVSAFTVGDDPLALWHDRLGHANLKSIRELERKDAVIGLDLTLRKKPANDCGDCKQGKQHKSVMKSKTLAVKKGAVIHSDVSGKMSTRSIGGSMYYVTFIDEFSRYITVVPITTKGEVLQQFKKFHVWFERKYDCRIKTLHCDGGGEYVGCDTYLSEHGIERVHIPPHAPEMNGLAERVNRTLMESARAMMFH